MSTLSLQCPSAQPGMQGAAVHGVVDAASRKILYLDAPVPVTDDLLASTAPLLPTEVLRFSAACQGSGCGHYTGSACSLVSRLVQILPAERVDLPRCSIRATCRWFFQERHEACRRCVGIVTDEFARGELISALAEPLNR